MGQENTNQKMATLTANLKNLGENIKALNERFEKSFSELATEIRRLADLAVKSQINEQKIQALEERFETYEQLIDKRIAEIQSQITWAVRTVVGAVILAVLAMVFRDNL